jgi:thymidylate synthase
MRNYHSLLHYVLTNGEPRNDRTGVGTLAIFDARLEFDLSAGFPLLTTKKVSFKNVISELCFFVNGKTNVDYLHKYNNRIWDAWANETGELGPIYGAQWRNWWGSEFPCVDQLKNLVRDLIKSPQSRRHLVSAWNVGEIPQMALPPCHYAFQFYVTNTGKLDLKVNMRSTDCFLGLPYNIASYAALNHMIAKICNYRPGRLIMSLADTHIYKNHVEAINTLLQRDPNRYALPQLRLNGEFDLSEEIHPEQFEIVGYESYPAIKAEVAI